MPETNEVKFELIWNVLGYSQWRRLRETKGVF